MNCISLGVGSRVNCGHVVG